MDENEFIRRLTKSLSVDTAEGDDLKRLAEVYGIKIPRKNEEGQWMTTMTDKEIRNEILNKIRGY